MKSDQMWQAYKILNQTILQSGFDGAKDSNQFSF